MAVSTTPTTASARLKKKIEAGAGQNGHGRHHDRDLEQGLGQEEVRIPRLEDVALVLEPLGLLLDVLLLGVVALFFFVEFLEQGFEPLARLGLHGGAALEQVAPRARSFCPRYWCSRMTLAW